MFHVKHLPTRYTTGYSGIVRTRSCLPNRSAEESWHSMQQAKADTWSGEPYESWPYGIRLLKAAQRVGARADVTFDVIVIGEVFAHDPRLPDERIAHNQK